MDSSLVFQNRVYHTRDVSFLNSFENVQTNEIIWKSVLFKKKKKKKPDIRVKFDLEQAAIHRNPQPKFLQSHNLLRSGHQLARNLQDYL